MVKNINNESSVAGGLAVGSTDDLPEGATNLYYTDARALAAVSADLGWQNATSIHSIPIVGPTTGGGQILISDGTQWSAENNLLLNNSNLTVTAGAYATPDAYYSRIGPVVYNKASGNVKVLTINTTAPNTGIILLFVTARDDITGTLYQSSHEFFFENAATVLTETFIRGFQSADFTRSVAGEAFELELNTTNAATVTVTMMYQTVTGANLTVTVP